MSARSADAVLEALRHAAWTPQMNVRLLGGTMYLHRCRADPRVLRMTHFPSARGKPAKEVFLFGDDHVDVEAAGFGDILIRPKTFASLGDLAEAIARHDAAIAAECEWRAAAPTGTDR